MKKIKEHKDLIKKVEKYKGEYKYIAISPKKEIVLFNSQTKLANENNLVQPNISSCLLKKDRMTHKGWYFFNFEDFFEIKIKNLAIILAPKKYIAIKFKTREYFFFENVKKFSNKKNLSMVTVGHLLKDKGNAKEHKGYKFLTVKEFYDFNLDKQKKFIEEFKINNLEDISSLETKIKN